MENKLQEFEIEVTHVEQAKGYSTPISLRMYGINHQKGVDKHANFYLAQEVISFWTWPKFLFMLFLTIVFCIFGYTCFELIVTTFSKKKSNIRMQL